MRDKPNKQPWNFLSKAKKAFAVGSLFTALIAADPSSAQTIAQKNDFPAGQTTAFNDKDPTAIDKTTTVSVVPNAFTFAATNVDKYFPDMKEHLDSLMNHFRDQEQKDTVNFLFQEYVTKNITDPKKQVASILYCIENFVFKWVGIEKNFSKTYDIGTFIDDNEYAYLINFNKWYNKRFKGYSKRLEVILTEQNKTMKEQNKQIDGIINTFTVNDVKTNQTIKNLVLETEKIYIKHGDVISPHLAELIKAAKQ